MWDRKPKRHFQCCSFLGTHLAGPYMFSQCCVFSFRLSITHRCATTCSEFLLNWELRKQENSVCSLLKTLVQYHTRNLHWKWEEKLVFLTWNVFTYCLSEILLIINKCMDKHVIMKTLLSYLLGYIQFYWLK